MTESRNVTLLQRASWIINTVFHQIIAVIFCFVVTSIFVANNDPNSYFAWHVALGVLGYVLFMLEGLIVFTKSNIYTLYIPHADKNLIHGIVMGLAATSVTAAFALKVYETPSDEHFTTNHGRVALAGLIFMWVTVIGGVMVQYISIFGKFLPANWLKLCHYCMGITSLVLGIAALCMGLDMAYFRIYVSNDKTATTVIVATALVTCWALMNPLMSFYNRVKSVFT